jgi:hypothetical protein
VPELIHLDGNGFPVVMNIPVPPWLEKDAQQAVEMCPALALRLAVDPKKKGSGGPSPAAVAAPALRAGLLGGRTEVTSSSSGGWPVGPATGPRAIGPA